jgi:hypothetical protein
MKQKTDDNILKLEIRLRFTPWAIILFSRAFINYLSSMLLCFFTGCHKNYDVDPLLSTSLEYSFVICIPATNEFFQKDVSKDEFRPIILLIGNCYHL